MQHNQNGSTQTDGAWKGRKSYYYSWVYDGYQESLPTQLSKVNSSNTFDSMSGTGRKRFRL